MPEFQAFSNQVEVNGQTVLSVIDGMGTYKDLAKNILRKQNIDHVVETDWYSQQAWLDAFEEISRSIGSNTLYMIGTKVPENAKFPPEIDSVEKALISIDMAYNLNHRGGDIGKYSYERIDDRSGRMVCLNPYPCDFDRGLIKAVGEKFSNGAPVSVTHDNSCGCRKKASDSCTYNIRW